MTPGRTRGGLLLAAILCLTPAARAGVTATDLEIWTISVLTPGAPAATQLWATVHLEGQYAVGTGTVFFTLDPRLLLSAPAAWSWGLSEAYLQMRPGPFDLHVGVERLPLETARLMLPFSIEPLDGFGRRLGRSGARLIWYPHPALRVRAAVFEEAGSLLPALSVRRQFMGFEGEVHVLMPAPGRLAVGLSGSGLAGNLVVYGEVWALTAPAGSRYALGISGSIPSGLWTVEAGYAAPEPGTPARQQLAGQMAYRVSEEVTLTGTVRVFADPDATRGQVVVQFTRTAGNNMEYAVALAAALGPEPVWGLLTTMVRFSF